MDRRIFFDHVRAAPFGGALTGSQVDGLTRILDEAERRGLGDLRILAYRLATVFHETDKAMVPVREGGSDSYLRGKPYWPWVGMGLVQVTWEANGRKFGATKPEDLLSWPISLRALFDGMDQGVFTGRKVGAYFTDKINDPTGARHVINGSDKAALIATYHGHFLAALTTASALAGPQIAPAPGQPMLNSIIGRINQAAAAQARASAPPVLSPGPVTLSTAAPSLWSRIKSLFTRKTA